jgi:hypothetical protein
MTPRKELTLRLTAVDGTQINCRLIRSALGEKACNPYGRRVGEYTYPTRVIQFYDGSRRNEHDELGVPIGRRQVEHLVGQMKLGRNYGTLKIGVYRRRDNSHGWPHVKVKRLSAEALATLVEWERTAEEIEELCERAVRFRPERHVPLRPSALA